MARSVLIGVWKEESIHHHSVTHTDEVNIYKEGSIAERFKALIRNPEVPSSSPLPASHAGVYSLLACLLACWGF